MSGKIRSKTATSFADSVSLTVNERILKECHTLYTDPENGTIFNMLFTHFVLSSSVFFVELNRPLFRQTILKRNG